MTTEKRKAGKEIAKWFFVALILIIALYFLIQGIRCGYGLRKARENLVLYESKTAELSYGSMTYVDAGEGEVILSVHGIFGGYDQAYDSVKNRKSQNRLLAPSRFGYLGSDVKGDGTPSEQAAAFAELLDCLGIEKVFILGTSAGGTPAIRFALDYPERVKGLILFCSAMPVPEKPETFLEYQAPPEPLLSDYAMYLISPLMPPLMGMPASTVKSIQPVSERKIGVVLDGKLTNPDMERNFEQYPIEELKAPVLILHSEDDTVASFEKVEKAKHRFPNLTLVAFPDGGHMMAGHGAEIDEALDSFINENQ
ncbi:MAG TPA: alpha/beta hydrolase [Clostridiales bacterium]|jgi:pimeloyl-ACP methyl ester carboxylesterase|nr:alpha/beta hydrolase [Clostridiales bacterium]